MWNQLRFHDNPERKSFWDWLFGSSRAPDPRTKRRYREGWYAVSFEDDPGSAERKRKGLRGIYAQKGPFPSKESAQRVADAENKKLRSEWIARGDDPGEGYTVWETKKLAMRDLLAMGLLTKADLKEMGF